MLLLASSVFRVSAVRGQDRQAMRAEWLISMHDSLTRADRQLICGPLYRETYGRTQGHPFLGDRGWQSATLVAGGRTCREVPVKYELCIDRLVYNHFHETGNFPVVLHRERIPAFSIDGKDFVLLSPGRQGLRGPETGYYQEVIRGKASLYVRWSKRYEPPSSLSGGRFVLFRYSLVMTGEGLCRIRSRRDLVRALPERSRELRDFLRRNHLVIRSDEGSGLMEAVRYYNSLEE